MPGYHVILCVMWWAFGKGTLWVPSVWSLAIKPLTPPILGAFAKLWKMNIGFCHVCPSAWNNSAPTRRLFMKFYIWVFCEKLCVKFKYHQNLTRITRTLHKDQCTYLTTSRSILLRATYVSDKPCGENQNKHFVFNNFFFCRNSCPLWDNVEIYCTAGQATAWQYGRTRSACWIPKATNTHSEYVITCFFSIATMVGRTHLNVTSYVHCLCYYNNFPTRTHYTLPQILIYLFSIKILHQHCRDYMYSFFSTLFETHCIHIILNYAVQWVTTVL